jgi:hypothetical protein
MRQATPPPWSAGNATLVACLLVGAPLCPAQAPHGADRVDTANVTAPAPVNPLTYTPMAARDRRRAYRKDLFNPLSLVRSAAGAGLGQWKDRPPEWKQGAEGFGRRFASSYAGHIVDATVMYGASSALHEDTRYVRSGQGGTGARIGYAVRSTFLARRDDGSRRFSFSRVLAFAGAAFISRLWQPRSTHGFGSASISLGTSVGVAAGFDVVREFWPHK